MKLFTKARSPTAAEPLSVPCPHIALVARWGSLEDMGRAERVSHYLCTACGRELLPDEVKSMEREKLL